MIFDSLDTLPMRIFIKIVETGDLKHLGGEEEENKKIWQSIEDEYKKLDSDGEFEKTLKKQCELHFLRCKYNAINISIQGLSIKKNDDLINILKQYGYIVTDKNYKEDLKTCKGYTEAIKTKIKKLEDDLKEGDLKGKFNLVESIIKLNIVFGFKIADAQKVTVAEFYELKKQAEILIKQRNKEKNNGRRDNY